MIFFFFVLSFSAENNTISGENQTDTQKLEEIEKIVSQQNPTLNQTISQIIDENYKTYIEGGISSNAESNTENTTQKTEIKPQESNNDISEEEKNKILKQKRADQEAMERIERERQEFIARNQQQKRENLGNKESILGTKKVENKEIICIGAHSRPLWGKDKCICEEGYFAQEDEVNTTGCYTCEPKCHKHASCTAPNICRCMYGLVGDGIKNCEMPSPTIKKIHIPQERLMVPVPVVVEYSAPNFIPYLAFCKFNEKKVEPAMIFNNGSIACLSPEKMRGDTKLQISFDGITYSKSEPYTIIPGVVEPPKKAVHLGIQPEGRSWKIPGLIILLIVICIGAFFGLHFFNDKNAAEASKEESSIHT